MTPASGHWLVLLLSFALAAAPVQAASRLEHRRHQNWGVPQGLPENQVMALLQSRDGYLWIGTRAGLVRFDGHRFTVYNRLNTPEFEQDTIYRLAEDAAGNIWMSTLHQLLSQQGPSFRRWSLKEYHADVGPYDVRGFFPASDGWLYLITGSSFLRVGEQGLQLVPPKVFTHGALWSCIEHPPGTLWVGGMQGVYSQDLRTERLISSFADVHGIERVVGFIVDKQGRLWANETLNIDWINHALFEFTGTNWICRQPQRVSNGARPVFAVPRSEGGFWQPGPSRFITSWTDGTTEHHAVPFSDHAWCALEDREGNLWIGTESSGLHCLYRSDIEVLTTSHGLVHPNAWAVLEAQNGSVWIGTENGLSQFHQGRFTNFTEKEGLSSNVIRALAEDQAGWLWIGTHSGLNSLDQGRITRWHFPGDEFSTKIRTLLVTPNNVLWVGSAGGLYGVDLNAPREPDQVIGPVNVLNPSMVYNATNGLAADVRALHLDPTGALWIGAYDGGLYRLEDGELKHFDATDGMQSDRVWAFHQSEDGTLWMGTERGLHRYRDGAIRVFTREHGLFDDVINSVVEDDQGWLWLGSDKGLCALRKADLDSATPGTKVRCEVFGESDGMLSPETNGQKSQPAVWKTRDARLWFPTTEGVAIVDPKRIRQARVAPPTIIEQVRANGRVIFGDDKLPDEGLFPEGANLIELPPGEGDVIEIRYAGNHFHAPEKVRFRYRLEGLETAWTEAGNRRYAYYANLSPGKYRFQVMAGTHHDEWDTAGASLAFYVTPFFYQTWTFRITAMAGLALAVFLIFRWRLGEEREKQALQKDAALARERTRIAQNLHDEFGASLTAIRMLTEVVERELGSQQRSVPHLQKLSQAVIDSGQTLRQIIWTNHPSDESWRGLVERVHQYAEEFLGTAEIGCHVSVEGQMPSTPVSPTMRLELFRAIKEALHNVVKHSEARAVRFHVLARNGDLTLGIEDDGKGFNPATVNGRGYGLGGMRERLARLGGRVEIRSVQDHGTSIRFHVPAATQVVP